MQSKAILLVLAIISQTICAEPVQKLLFPGQYENREQAELELKNYLKNYKASSFKLEQERKISYGGSNFANVIALSDSYLVAGLDNHTNLVYDVKNGNVMMSQEVQNTMTSAAISDELVVFGNALTNTDIYNISNWQNTYTTTDSYYKSAKMDSLALNPDDTILGTCAGAFVDFYFNTPWSSSVRTHSQDGFTYITDCAFTRDGKYFVSASPYSTEIWKIESNDQVMHKILESSGEEKITVDFSNKYLAIGQGNKNVDIYEVETWNKVTTIQAPANVTTVAFSADDYLAIGTLNGVVLYKQDNFNQVYQQWQDMNLVHSLQFSESKFAVSYTFEGQSFVSIYGSGSSGAKLLVSTILMVLSFIFA